MTDLATSKGFRYIFPAIRGRQADREYYVVMCPLRLIPKLFLFNEQELAPELRAQRTVNRARIPEIAKYILKHPTSYVFSSLTASIDGEMSFEPVGVTDPSVGNLMIPLTARFVLNDGQHRRAAIEEAINANPAVGEETISVVFYPDLGFRNSQQMFSDLNRHAMRPTKSLGILYDYYDELAAMTRHVADTVPAFRGLIEKERTTIPNRSRKLFTLSSLYEANAALLSKSENDSISPEGKNLAVKYWSAVSEQIPDWFKAQRGELNPSELRQEYVHSHGIALQALGILGRALIQSHPDDWSKVLEKLKRVNWSRSNSGNWEGRATFGGRISPTSANIKLTAALLKRNLGLTLTREENDMESRLRTAEPAYATQG